jgi:hypothetical protein
MTDTPENRVKRECLDYLRLRHIYCWSNPSGAVRIRPGRFMRFGKKGSSDILGILPGGRLLCAECKAPDRGRLSPEQKQFIADVQELRALALVVRGWNELDEALREAGYVSNGPLFEGNNAAPQGMA